MDQGPEPHSASRLCHFGRRDMRLFGLPCALLCLPVAHADCIAEFVANPDFLEYSGYAFKVPRGEPIPEHVQDFFYMKHDPYVIQLTKYAMWAHRMLTACWSIGGRVWEVRLSLNATLGLEEGSTGVHTAICAPYSCSRQQVLHRVAIKVVTRDFNAATPAKLQGVAQPLSSWKFINVRFAIVGTEGCGTTSLQKNLNQHPDIRFTRQDGREVQTKEVNSYQKRCIASPG